MYRNTFSSNDLIIQSLEDDFYLLCCPMHEWPSDISPENPDNLDW